MAKQKLTKAAVSFIIEKRNDWNVNYTFDDIAKLLKENFDITITEQGVSKSYRKHKDNQESKVMPIIPTKQEKQEKQETDINLDTSNMTKAERYKHRLKLIKIGKLKSDNPVETNARRDFDEDAGKKYNFEDFLIPKEE